MARSYTEPHSALHIYAIWVDKHLRHGTCVTLKIDCRFVRNAVPDRSFDEGLGGEVNDGQVAFRLWLELAHHEIEDKWNQSVRK
jgi:hypothetical protein